MQQNEDELTQKLSALESGLTARLEALEQQLADDRSAFGALKTQLSQNDGASFTRRPAATGSDPKSGVQTDC